MKYPDDFKAPDVDGLTREEVNSLIQDLSRLKTNEVTTGDTMVRREEGVIEVWRLVAESESNPWCWVLEFKRVSQVVEGE
jgi:hypothetical protein